MIELIHGHWLPLASQGNIYSLATLDSFRGSSKVLVASLKRTIYSFEYQQHSKSRLNPLVKELLFTYIPNGAEIIAIDAFNKSNTGDEFVIGITIMKPTGETSMERYLNIYTEGAGEGEENNSLETIAQNCLMVELSYTPYLLYHTVIPQSTNNEIVWLISGNDNKIHLIKEDKQNHSYTESQLEKYFPELHELKTIALWIDIYYFDDFKWRLTAISCECGLFKLAKVDVLKLKVAQTWLLRYDNPIGNIRIFPHRNDIKKPPYFKTENHSTDGFKLNILLNSGNTAAIFQDILNQEMNSDITLNLKESTSDCILCSCVADINMDGKNEILLGTYKHEVLIFASSNNTWNMIDKKSFDAPVYSISYLDLAGDGVKVLVVLTQRSVHIMQHKLQEVEKKWQDRFSKLASLLSDSS
ncbi:KICSTOR complex protein kaptin-like [Copidosoma floridanum]|uniref:KICSTOR complex protein kaptin-like n=1 Tax=Copidosoma floridanum TaxID=29053 RepID=UPI0006C97C4B|nr:KICSTOR complex protein kaptin-like [Copidosoma floridanum]